MEGESVMMGQHEGVVAKGVKTVQDVLAWEVLGVSLGVILLVLLAIYLIYNYTGLLKKKEGYDTHAPKAFLDNLNLDPDYTQKKP